MMPSTSPKVLSDRSSPLDFPRSPRFVFRRRLGSGGFGVVFEAYDEQRHTLVAIKTLHRTDPSSLYRLKQEFRALADIAHPNLVTLYELFSEGQQWYFTMELCPGEDVLTHVRRPVASGVSPSWTDSRALDSTREAPVPILTGLTLRSGSQATPGPVAAAPISTAAEEARLREVLRQLARGLCFLHDAGIVHRDIKPSNMLVTPEGRLRLLDFGLVREMGDWSLGGSASNHGIVGTPAYMAPEQAAAERVSPAADWYSVGVFLYEALTGRQPFDGTWMEVLTKKQRQPPVVPLHLSPDLPRDLSELCMDLLARDPRSRPGGREVLRRLAAGPGALGAVSGCSRGSAPGLGADDPSGDVQSRPSRRQAAALIGRLPELSALSESFTESRQGRPAVALLSGGSGMGKSILLQRFADGLPAVVFSARCYQQESVPYKALDGVMDTLSRHLRRLPIVEAQALLPPDILVLARLFPVLLQVAAVEQAPRRPVDIADQQEVRRRAFAALRELLGRLADQHRVVVYIDDLQWGDVDSSALLLDLLQLPQAPALLLVLSYRSEEVGTSPCLLSLLPALRALGASGRGRAPREIQVGPLSQEDALSLGRGLLGAELRGMFAGPSAGPNVGAVGAHVVRAAKALEPDLQAIVAEAAGNPSLVEELVHFQAAAYREALEAGALVGNGAARSKASESSDPSGRFAGTLATLDEAFQRRVARLPEAARSLLQAVAVAGGPIERGIAQQAAAVPEAAAAQMGAEQALALLRTARLVRLRTTREQQQIEIYHERLGARVVAQLSASARREQHLRLAHALVGSGGRDDEEAISRHYQEAGERAAAARHAVRAAEQAEAALAFERAARMYERALLGVPEDELTFAWGTAVDASAAGKPLRLRLAEALKNAGRGEAAAQAYLATVPALAGQAPLLALELRRSAAEQLLRSGHLRQGMEIFRKVLREVHLGLPWQWMSLLRLLFLRVYLLVRGLDFRECTAAAVPPVERLRIDTCWSAASGLGNQNTIAGAYFGALHLLLALRSGEPLRIARGLAMEVAYGALPGGPRPSKAERLARERLVALEQRLGAPYVSAAVPLFSGCAAVLHGQWPEALAQLDQAAAILQERCTGVSWELCSAHLYSLLCLGILGRLRELSERLPTVVQDARGRGDLYLETTVRTRVGHLPELRADRPDAARNEVQGAVAAWSREERRGFHMQHYFSMIALGECALYQESGAGEGALRVVEDGWRGLRRSQLLHAQSIYGDAHTLRGNALLSAAAALEQADPRRRKLISAARGQVRRLLRQGMPWINAKAWMIDAGLRALEGEREAAAALLAKAEAVFKRAGMELHVAAARRRRGQLAGGAGGQVLIEQADGWMIGEGIARPERMAAMLAPGRWS